MRVEIDYCIMRHCRFRVTNRASLRLDEVLAKDRGVGARSSFAILCVLAMVSSFSIKSCWLRKVSAFSASESKGFGDEGRIVERIRHRQ